MVEGEKAKWAEKLRAKGQKYLAFLGYLDEVRKHIYTANPVESLNAGKRSRGWSWEGISLPAKSRGEPVHPGGELTRLSVEEAGTDAEG